MASVNFHTVLSLVEGYARLLHQAFRYFKNPAREVLGWQPRR